MFATGLQRSSLWFDQGAADKTKPPVAFFPFPFDPLAFAAALALEAFFGAAAFFAFAFGASRH